MSGPRFRPRAIVFDWDNTLVDSWPSIHLALEATFRAMGHAPWSLEETKSRVRASLRDSFPQLFGARWEEAGRVFYQHFEACHLDRLAACEGAAEMLDGIAQLGIYLAVISNKQGNLLRAEAGRLGWRAYFGALIGALDAPRDKPAVDPVHLALRPADLAPGEDVWYVGDTEMDMRFAANAGCLPVLLRARPPEEAEFAPHPPSRHFSSGLKLLDFVQALEDPSRAQSK